MDETRIYDLNDYLRAQRKEDIKKLSNKLKHQKISKINNFRNSIGKLFRMKSQSEKSLKHEDLIAGNIPSTIYLTPHSSLPRDTKCANKQKTVPPAKVLKYPVRHSCSDFTCRRSNTFCTYKINKDLNKSEQNLKINPRLISPPNSAFYTSTLEELEKYQITSPITNVPHSKSVPLQLSQSQQNITQSKNSTIDIHCSAKRTARKKSIFNCSLFRKRSNSRSKSTDKIHLNKPSIIKCLDKSKNHPQLTDEQSVLSDRCLTLPNLKSSEVDLTSHVNNAQLLSIDLIKDYLNRSDNAISTSVQRNSVDNSSYYQYSSQNPSSVSVQNSPLSLPNRKSINELRKFENSKLALYESLMTENSQSNCQGHETKSTTISAYSEVYNGKIIQSADFSPVNTSALENSIYHKISETNKFVNNSTRVHLTRQISAPHCVLRQTSTKLPHISHPSTGAVEFWTRPYQEKVKASRRRLLDDKVGSKEALLRSMSPQNIKIYEGENAYDTSYHLHMIPEPPNSVFLESDERINWITSTDSIIQSNSYYSISQEFPSSILLNPMVENRLSESPVHLNKKQDPISKSYSIDYNISEDVKTNVYDNHEDYLKIDNLDKNNRTKKENKKIPEINESQWTNKNNIKFYCPYSGQNVDESVLGIKDLKGIRSSTELILTRTPTPPHSFAESSLSSVPPVPKEFLNDSSLHPCGNINLLYSSDNSSISNEEFAEFDRDFIVPIPPPRTDSAIRSMQYQQNNDPDKSELEYDMTDDFLPIFSGANIDKCDIAQYHKWLEKLPYKLSEFPDILHSRKSTVSAKKSVQSENLVDVVPEQIGLLELKHLKSYRKSIKSWNMSDSSKNDYDPSTEVNNGSASINESGSMKKSFSCDHSLHSSNNAPSITDLDHEVKLSQNLTTAETTLLRQYSHLYSLKFAPFHNPIVDSNEITSVFKSNRSKSIDLRNFLSTNDARHMINSAKCSENRKSAPNTKIQLGK